MYGALGVDNLEDHKKPTRVDSLQAVAYIAAGYNQSFAIDREGKTYSFGANGPWLGHNNLTKSYSWLSRCTTAIFPFHACACSVRCTLIAKREKITATHPRVCVWWW